LQVFQVDQGIIRDPTEAPLGAFLHIKEGALASPGAGVVLSFWKKKTRSGGLHTVPMIYVYIIMFPTARAILP